MPLVDTDSPVKVILVSVERVIQMFVSMKVPFFGGVMACWQCEGT